MREHKSFVFHESYAKVLWRIQDPVQKGRYAEMITQYAFNKAVPSEDDPNYNLFLLIQPILDKSQERAESGTRGGLANRKEYDSFDMSTKLASGTSESDKDDERNKERNKEQELEEMFTRFWSVYPRKDAKKTARKTFYKIMGKAANPEALLTTIIEAVKVARHSDGWTKDNGHYIPLPASWLNSERWEDQGVSEDLADDHQEVDKQSLDDAAVMILKDGGAE